MDTNRDGVITREEWRGNDRSFDIHDWNRDGVLSNEEVRPAGRRARGTSGGNDERAFRAFDTNRDGYLTRREWYVDINTFTVTDRNRDRRVSVDEFMGLADDEADERFADLDHNNDARISLNEWHADRAVFNRLDRNRDRWLSLGEFLGIGNERAIASNDFDHNGDNYISRDEWHGDMGTFDRADRNRDGRLSRWELMGRSDRDTPTPGGLPATPAFDALDANRDGGLERHEWRGDDLEFQMADRDGNRRLDRNEFELWQRGATRSQAYRAGYDRGLAEGRAAGREDKERNQGWQLEGQRELEQADSGYTNNLGPRNEYQDGYRSGFRRGYPEGFGPR